MIPFFRPQLTDFKVNFAFQKTKIYLIAILSALIFINSFRADSSTLTAIFDLTLNG